MRRGPPAERVLSRTQPHSQPDLGLPSLWNGEKIIPIVEATPSTVDQYPWAEPERHCLDTVSAWLSFTAVLGMGSPRSPTTTLVGIADMHFYGTCNFEFLPRLWVLRGQGRSCKGSPRQRALGAWSHSSKIWWASKQNVKRSFSWKTYICPFGPKSFKLMPLRVQLVQLVLTFASLDAQKPSSLPYFQVFGESCWYPPPPPKKYHQHPMRSSELTCPSPFLSPSLCLRLAGTS